MSNPPQRPGATLWSIAAGPLVNVVLLPVLIAAVIMSRSLGWAQAMPDVYQLLRAVMWIDVSLLVFNMLPIYPLDGGQILRSLLWFVLGRARSLMVATALGFVGVVGFIGLALWVRSIWFGAISVFMLMNCWSGLRHAQGLLRLARLPRREGFACLSCRTAPPIGAYWKCGQCEQPFDTFQSRGRLSALRGTIRHDGVPGLRQIVSHERMGRWLRCGRWRCERWFSGKIAVALPGLCC